MTVQLPLGGILPVDRLSKSSAAAGGKTSRGPQYVRLFGLTRPDQVFAPAASPSLSPEVAASCGSPALLCDPTRPESHFLFHALTAAGHPSAASLASVAALRERHIAKGHSPAADARHGWVYFKAKADEAYRDAIAARLPDNRRKRLITSIAILVAQLDAEDFTTSQQDPAP